MAMVVIVLFVVGGTAKDGVAHGHQFNKEENKDRHQGNALNPIV